MLLIQEHAEEWKVDTDRIALCGFSAGAHNVAMYANSWNSTLFSNYFKKNAEMFGPVAVILGYIAGDYYFTKEEEIAEQKEMFFRCPTQHY